MEAAKRQRDDQSDKPYKKRKKQYNPNSRSETDSYNIVELPGKGRPYSLSIAVPASILEETVLKDDLRVHIVGQLARSATIFGVDEIVIYNDHCWRTCANSVNKQEELIDLMYTVLAYQECPQYLRKSLIPHSPHLANAGLLNPTAAPHHLKANDWCAYREGVVTSRNGKAGSFVNVGLAKDVSVPHKTAPLGSRVTVKLPDASRVLSSPVGELVSPEEPRLHQGVYWGYSVRLANSLAEVFTGSAGAEGYDLLIGTSDKGTPLATTPLPRGMRRVMLVFGGVAGLEKALDRDTSLAAERPQDLFHCYVDVCPSQHSRTIRTEEAVPIALAHLAPSLAKACGL